MSGSAVWECCLRVLSESVSGSAGVECVWECCLGVCLGMQA